MLALQSILCGIQVGKSMCHNGGNNLMNKCPSNSFVDKGTDSWRWFQSDLGSKQWLHRMDSEIMSDHHLAYQHIWSILCEASAFLDASTWHVFLTNGCGLLRSLDEMSSREAAAGTWRGRSISYIIWYLISCSLDLTMLFFCMFFVWCHKTVVCFDFKMTQTIPDRSFVTPMFFFPRFSWSPCQAKTLVETTHHSPTSFLLVPGCSLKPYFLYK